MLLNAAIWPEICANWQTSLRVMPAPGCSSIAKERFVSSLDIGYQFVQIGREAVGNALRYAKARSVRLRLGFANVNIELSIEDDGIGFQPDHATAPRGFGLSTMRQRASRIDATFTLRTSPGTGTAIRISAPCPAFSDPL